MEDTGIVVKLTFFPDIVASRITVDSPYMLDQFWQAESIHEKRMPKEMLETVLREKSRRITKRNGQVAGITIDPVSVHIRVLEIDGNIIKKFRLIEHSRIEKSPR